MKFNISDLGLLHHRFDCSHFLFSDHEGLLELSLYVCHVPQRGHIFSNLKGGKRNVPPCFCDLFVLFFSVSAATEVWGGPGESEGWWESFGRPSGNPILGFVCRLLFRRTYNKVIKHIHVSYFPASWLIKKPAERLLAIAAGRRAERGVRARATGRVNDRTRAPWPLVVSGRRRSPQRNGSFRSRGASPLFSICSKFCLASVNICQSITIRIIIDSYVLSSSPSATRFGLARTEQNLLPCMHACTVQT